VIPPFHAVLVPSQLLFAKSTHQVLKSPRCSLLDHLRLKFTIVFGLVLFTKVEFHF
jgi:hypothetical protein